MTQAKRTTRRSGSLKWGLGGLGTLGVGLAACPLVCVGLVPILIGLGAGTAAVAAIEAGAGITGKVLVIAGVLAIALAAVHWWRQRRGSTCGDHTTSGPDPGGPVDPSALGNEPIVCTLDGHAVRRRLDELRAVFERGFLAGERIPDGVRWRFRAAPGLEAELRSLAEREHECCRFFRFDIQAVGHEIWWDTRVDDARAQPVLEEFFTLPRQLAVSSEELRDGADPVFWPGQASISGSRDWDLLVVGGGSAGFAAAIAAAERSRSVGVVNDGPLGGTCTNRGCIPSKALNRAADTWWRAGHHPFAGIGTAPGDLDWGTVQTQKDTLIADLRQRRYADVLAAYPEITLVEGRATFQPDGSVQVGRRSYRAARYVVAVGARPRTLPLPGVEEVDPLNSTTLMELPALPGSLIVLGGRAVALELGQAMARLGVEVTILQRSGRLVPDHEEEIGRAIAQYLQEDGITVVTGVHVESLSRDGDARVVNGHVMGKPRRWRADQVLMAVGRRANTDGLGLESVGVEMTPEGTIAVDELLQTTNPAIYAAGDATPVPEYVYVAAASGTLAAENALGDEPTPLDLSVVPGVIFTDPQIATVGMTETQARTAGVDVRTTTIGMDPVARAQVAHDLCGLVKLVAESATGRLLGAHVLTAEAGEIVPASTLAIRHRLTVDDLVGTLFPYLTYAEALRLAAISFDRDLDRLSCCV